MSIRQRLYPDPASVSVLVRVDPRNTSRQCHKCLHIGPANRESQAVFRCIECGHEAHADTNAAENIRDRAIDTLLGAGTSGGELCGRTPGKATTPGTVKVSRERTRKSEAGDSHSSVNHSAA